MPFILGSLFACVSWSSNVRRLCLVSVKLGADMASVDGPVVEVEVSDVIVGVNM